jgi:putative DNA primase/helicase
MTTSIPPKNDLVGPMLDLVRHLTSHAREQADENNQLMHWLLCWLAYPIQNPGEKMETAVIMHGNEGTGKSLLFDTVAAIYGNNGAVVGPHEVADTFNQWMSNKRFVVIDDAWSAAWSTHNKNQLKALITSSTVQINRKGWPMRQEVNCMNFVFISGASNPLIPGSEDRRFCVIHAPKAKNPAIYAQFGRWRDSGGLQAFHHFLLTYPLKDFRRDSPPPAQLQAKTHGSEA